MFKHTLYFLHSSSTSTIRNFWQYQHPVLMHVSSNPCKLEWTLKSAIKNLVQQKKNFRHCVNVQLYSEKSHKLIKKVLIVSIYIYRNRFKVVMRKYNKSQEAHAYVHSRVSKRRDRIRLFNFVQFVEWRKRTETRPLLKTSNSVSSLKVMTDHWWVSFLV
jgi:hypothetical protein